MSEEPSANPLMYEHSDDGDHPSGGACLRVFRDEDSADRFARYSEEYFTALVALQDASGEEPSGWQFAAPAVFLAHHACELALKVKWLRTDPEIFVESRKFKQHDLFRLIDKIDGAEDSADSYSADSEHLRVLASQLRALTNDGISIRYATIDERWCCLNLVGLVKLVDDFQTIALRLDD